jgi:hypothetical protein
MRFECVTGPVSVSAGDGIVIRVHNHSGGTENARIRVFHNNGAGAALEGADGGDLILLPTFTSALAFTVQTSGPHWVQVESSSDFVIATVSFEKLTGSVFTPFTIYSPGDFAVLEQGVRIR